MNAETIAALCNINNDFYRSQCASFSETRNHPWPGWRRCLEVLAADCPERWRIEQNVGHAGGEAACVDRSTQPASPTTCHESHNAFSVLDLACGNLRFEAFLAEAFPQADIAFYAVDNCDELVSEKPSVRYQSLDVMQVLQDGHTSPCEQCDERALLGEALTAPACDLVVSFGFMHHVPGTRYREEVLAALVSKTRSGGYVAVSFWQFLNDDSLAAKALAVHHQAASELALPELESGDYLLGWKNTPGAYRYCHHFSEEEIERLAVSVADKARVVARFHADGRTGNLNSYLVLKVN